MSKFKIFTLLIIIVEIVLIVSVNIMYFQQNDGNGGREYLVEASRLIKEIEGQRIEPSEIEAISLHKYDSIVGISEFVAGKSCANDYLVEEIDGKLYRIEYVEDKSSSLPLYINISFLCMMLVTIIVLVIGNCYMFKFDINYLQRII